MGTPDFSRYMNRSRLDQLDHEMALIAFDMLKTYQNENNQVHEAFLKAGYAVYQKQYHLGIDAWFAYRTSEAERLLQIERQTDGAWSVEAGPIEREIDAAPNKARAGIGEIEAEILALALPFEERGYQPIEIGRALGRVGLSFAPVSFIRLEAWAGKRMLEGYDSRMREFLDGKLGPDRYGKNKGTRH